MNYAMLGKIYGLGGQCFAVQVYELAKQLEQESIFTSYTKHQHLTMRMFMRCFMRKIIGFSKRLDRYIQMIALYFCQYNFYRIHKGSRTTLAAASIFEEPLNMGWAVGLINTLQKTLTQCTNIE